MRNGIESWESICSARKRFETAHEISIKGDDQARIVKANQLTKS